MLKTTIEDPTTRMRYLLSSKEGQSLAAAASLATSIGAFFDANVQVHIEQGLSRIDAINTTKRITSLAVHNAEVAALSKAGLCPILAKSPRAY